ncbi:MAG: hypothetical protein ACRENE_31490 [Polyangiaceae bacterium]
MGTGGLRAAEPTFYSGPGVGCVGVAPLSIGDCYVFPDGIVVYGSDGLVLVGGFRGAFTFDSVHLTATQTDDAFVARISD